jgi:hypothetical protein
LIMPPGSSNSAAKHIIVSDSNVIWRGKCDMYSFVYKNMWLS